MEFDEVEYTQLQHANSISKKIGNMKDTLCTVPGKDQMSIKEMAKHDIAMVSSALKIYSNKRKAKSITSMSESQSISHFSTKQLKLRWLKKTDYNQPNSIIEYDVLNPPDDLYEQHV